MDSKVVLAAAEPPQRPRSILAVATLGVLGAMAFPVGLGLIAAGTLAAAAAGTALAASGMYAIVVAVGS